MSKIKITLTCPLPRVGFADGKGEHVDNELVILDDYLAKADGDIVVFPEGFVRSDHIIDAENIIRKYHKWVVMGSQDIGEHQSLHTLLIDPEKGVIYKHTKTSLTDGDRKINCIQGNKISAIDTPFGKVGLVLCYEMHFPEVARIECIEGAQILFNTIGTGMWHEQQFDEWASIAKARAIENRCFVLGCTHYCDPIPLMFAYNPHGKCLSLNRNLNGMVTVEIDLNDIDERDYFRDRNPKAYIQIAKEENL